MSGEPPRLVAEELTQELEVTRMLGGLDRHIVLSKNSSGLPQGLTAAFGNASGGASDRKVSKETRSFRGIGPLDGVSMGM
jgi:hypothetical protein